MAERKIDEFVFVLLAGLILIIVFMVGFPSTEQTPNQTQINATTGGAQDIVRFIKMGDFAVSYSIGTEVLESKQNFQAYRSYFSEQFVNMFGDITEDKLAILKGATITLTVESTTGLGNLIVLVNEQVVYNQKADVGIIVINVDKALLKSSNTVTVQTDFDSWKFWSRSLYNLRSAKFEIQYQGSSFKDFSFYMDEKEFNKYKFGRLEFSLNPDGASQTNNLMIKVNNERFYYSKPPLVKFAQDLPKYFLRLGDNTISFSVDPTATYNLQDVTLTVVSGR